MPRVEATYEAEVQAVKGRPLPRWMFGIALLLTAIAVFTPLLPFLPDTGVDPSWAAAINQAVDQGLTFGREIIFTYGPYASIFTRMYSPATDGLMTFGGFYFGLSFFLASYLTFSREPWHVQLLLLLALSTVAPALQMRDALFFVYPLLVATVILGNTQKARASLSAFLVAVLVSPLGLLPLIKQSMAVASFIAIVLSVILLATRKRWGLVLIAILVPPISMMLFWILSGQSILDLPLYFYSAQDIISGYPEAMALDGSPFELTAYLVTAGLVMRTVAMGSAHDDRETKWCRIILFSLFLALAFKAGFVRQDLHALIAGNFIVLCAALASPLCKPGRFLPVMMSAILTWAVILYNRPGVMAETAMQLSNTYSWTWKGLELRIGEPGFLPSMFRKRLVAIQEGSPLPVLPGTADIYSYDQTRLFSAEYSWNPRPVFQSYSAYTPELAELNRLHLTGHNRPDYLFFSIQPIDQRLPSLEDGASWRAILTGYQLESSTNKYLILRRKSSFDSLDPIEIRNDSSIHSLGETVTVGGQEDVVFAKLRLKLTLFGRLCSLAFRPGQVSIIVRTRDSVEHRFRLIPTMARSDFLLSPLIETTEEFAKLYEPSTRLEDDAVEAFSIVDEGWLPTWSQEYEVERIRTHLRASKKTDGRL